MQNLEKRVRQQKMQQFKKHTFSCTPLSDKSVGMNMLGTGKCSSAFGAFSTHCYKQTKKNQTTKTLQVKVNLKTTLLN